MQNVKLWVGVLACAILIGFFAWWTSDEPAGSEDSGTISRAALPVDPHPTSASNLESPAPMQPTTASVASDDRTLDAFLVARLVDEHGAPLGHLDIAAGLRVRSATHGKVEISQSVQSDARGLIRVAFPIPACTDVAGALTAVVMSRGPSREAQGTFQLPSAIHSGDNDLGVIVARVPEVVLAGTVVEARSGAPVARAEITAVLRGESGREPREYHALSDRAGKFMIPGETPSGMLEVSVVHKDHASPQAAHVRPGTKDLRIQLPSGSTLAGLVLADPEVPLEELEVRVPSGPRHHIHTGKVHADGSFYLTDLDSGSVGLTVSHEGSDALAWIPDIHLRGGEAADDPRIKCIDLRGKVHCFRLTVVDPDGKAVEHGTATLRIDRQWSESIKLRPVPTPLVVRDGDYDVFIEAEGFRPAHLVHLSADQRVVMTRGVPIRLRWSSTLPLPRTPLFVGVVLVRTDAPKEEIEGRYRETRDHELWFGTDGDLSTDVPSPGKYEIHWTVEKRSTQGKENQTLMEPNPASITVLDSTTEQAFDVGPGVYRFSDALKMLAQ